MRLIDADRLLETLSTGGHSSVRKVISREPTIDAVEVVRCKDCIFARPVIGTSYLKFCKKFDYEMWHEGFCYYGKRKG